MGWWGKSKRSSRPSSEPASRLSSRPVTPERRSPIRDRHGDDRSWGPNHVESFGMPENSGACKLSDLTHNGDKLRLSSMVEISPKHTSSNVHMQRSMSFGSFGVMPQRGDRRSVSSTSAIVGSSLMAGLESGPVSKQASSRQSPGRQCNVAESQLHADNTTVAQKVSRSQPDSEENVSAGLVEHIANQRAAGARLIPVTLGSGTLISQNPLSLHVEKQGGEEAGNISRYFSARSMLDDGDDHPLSRNVVFASEQVTGYTNVAMTKAFSKEAVTLATDLPKQVNQHLGKPSSQTEGQRLRFSSMNGPTSKRKQHGSYESHGDYGETHDVAPRDPFSWDIRGGPHGEMFLGMAGAKRGKPGTVGGTGSSESEGASRGTAEDGGEVLVSEQESVSSAGWGVWQSKGQPHVVRAVESATNVAPFHLQEPWQTSKKVAAGLNLLPNHGESSLPSSPEWPRPSSQSYSPSLESFVEFGKGSHHNQAVVAKTAVSVEREAEFGQTKESHRGKGKVLGYEKLLSESYRDGWEADEEGGILTSDEEEEKEAGICNRELVGWGDRVPSGMNGEGLEGAARADNSNEDDDGFEKHAIKSSSAAPLRDDRAAAELAEKVTEKRRHGGFVEKKEGGKLLNAEYDGGHPREDWTTSGKKRVEIMLDQWMTIAVKEEEWVLSSDESSHESAGEEDPAKDADKGADDRVRRSASVFLTKQTQESPCSDKGKALTETVFENGLQHCLNGAHFSSESGESVISAVEIGIAQKSAEKQSASASEYQQMPEVETSTLLQEMEVDSRTGITSIVDSSRDVELAEETKPEVDGSATLVEISVVPEAASNVSDTHAERKSRLWEWAIMGAEGIPAVIDEEPPSKEDVAYSEQTPNEHGWPESDTDESDGDEAEGREMEESKEEGNVEKDYNQKPAVIMAESAHALEGLETGTVVETVELSALPLAETDNEDAAGEDEEQKGAAAPTEDGGGFGSPLSLGPSSCQASPDKGNQGRVGLEPMAAFNLEGEPPEEEERRRPFRRKEGTGPVRKIWQVTQSDDECTRVQVGEKPTEHGSDVGVETCSAEGQTRVALSTGKGEISGEQEMGLQLKALETLSQQLEAGQDDSRVDESLAKCSRRRAHPYGRTRKARKGWSKGRINIFAGTSNNQPETDIKERDYPEMVFATMFKVESTSRSTGAAEVEVAHSQETEEEETLYGKEASPATRCGEQVEGNGNADPVVMHHGNNDRHPESNGRQSQLESEARADREKVELIGNEGKLELQTAEDAKILKPEKQDEGVSVMEEPEHQEEEGSEPGPVYGPQEDRKQLTGGSLPWKAKPVSETQGTGTGEEAEQVMAAREEHKTEEDEAAEVRGQPEESVAQWESQIAQSLSFTDAKSAVHSVGVSLTVDDDAALSLGKKGEEPKVSADSIPVMEVANPTSSQAESKEKVTRGTNGRLKRAHSLPEQGGAPARRGLEQRTRSLQAERDSLLVEREALERQWEEGRDELNRAAEMAKALRVALESLTKAHLRRSSAGDHDNCGGENVKSVQQSMSSVGPFSSKSEPSSPPKNHPKAAMSTSVPGSPGKETRSAVLMSGMRSAYIKSAEVPACTPPLATTEADRSNSSMSLVRRVDSQSQCASWKEETSHGELQNGGLLGSSTWRMATSDLTFGSSTGMSANGGSREDMSLSGKGDQSQNQTAKSDGSNWSNGRGERPSVASGHGTEESQVAKQGEPSNTDKGSFHTRLHHLRSQGRKETRRQPVDRTRWRQLHGAQSFNQAVPPWRQVTTDSSPPGGGHGYSSDWTDDSMPAGSQLEIPALLANVELPPEEAPEWYLLDCAERKRSGPEKNVQTEGLAHSVEKSTKREECIKTDLSWTATSEPTSLNFVHSRKEDSSAEATGGRGVESARQCHSVTGADEQGPSQHSRARWQDKGPWVPPQAPLDETRRGRSSQSSLVQNVAQASRPPWGSPSPSPSSSTSSSSSAAKSVKKSLSTRKQSSSSSSSSPPSATLPQPRESQPPSSSPTHGPPSPKGIPLVPVYGTPSPSLFATRHARVSSKVADIKESELHLESQVILGSINQKHPSSLVPIVGHETSVPRSSVDQNQPSLRRKCGSESLERPSIQEASSPVLASSVDKTLKKEKGPLGTGSESRATIQTASARAHSRPAASLPDRPSQSHPVKTSTPGLPPGQSQLASADGAPCQRPIKAPARKKLPALWPTASDTEDEGPKAYPRFGTAVGQASKLGSGSGALDAQQGAQRRGLDERTAVVSAARSRATVGDGAGQRKQEMMAARPGVGWGQMRGIEVEPAQKSGRSVQARGGQRGRQAGSELDPHGQRKVESIVPAVRAPARVDNDDARSSLSLPRGWSESPPNQRAQSAAPPEQAVSGQVAPERAPHRTRSLGRSAGSPTEAAAKAGMEKARATTPPPGRVSRMPWGGGAKRTSTPTRSRSPLRSLWTNMSGQTR